MVEVVVWRIGIVVAVVLVVVVVVGVVVVVVVVDVVSWRVKMSKVCRVG